MNWRRFLRRDAADAKVREELENYIDLTAKEYIARGVNESEAITARAGSLGMQPRFARRFIR
jgi:hypothetical protein